MAWGLHDSVEFEMQKHPAVTVITTAFETAAGARAVVLGLPDHPVVMVDHPLTTRSPAEVDAMADRAASRVVAGLVRGGEA